MSMVSALGLQSKEPCEILTLIEDLLVQLLEGLSQGHMPDLQVPTMRKSTKRALPLDEGAELQRCNQVSLIELSFTARQGAGCFRFTRILRMLTVVHELVRTARCAPQRDIFYQLKSDSLFATPRHVAEAIEDVSMLLEVPRCNLGISASSKGLIQGLLDIRLGPDGELMTCSSIRSIPGDCTLIQTYRFSTTAKNIVIVEKDAVFQRLVGEGFTAMTDSILITAKGMPDIATRHFLKCLSSACPDLIIVAVVDWNPSGIAIMKTYKYGSSNTLQSMEYSLPGLRWLAMHAEQVDDLPESAFQPLTQHDRMVINSLRDCTIGQVPSWSYEIDIMESNNIKAEIEAAYRHSGYGAFTRDLARRLREGRYH